MLKFYNTLTKKKEEFKSIDQGKVKIYNCGPTVYNYAHIGNMRRYIMSDVLRRYLEYLGYEVREIMNITDVGHLTQDDIDSGEDKIIAQAKKEKKTPKEIARFYTEAFFEDLEKLNIQRAHFYPRATQHIPDMIKMVGALLEKGYAYEAEDGIYFDVTKFPDYGKLSGNTLDQMKMGARKDPSPYKKHPYDFALWLKADPGHLMQWGSPWGKGYPGWHIECSVMSMKYLGNTLDIHTGGEDNIFPHHENEIAQSESTTKKPFVNYWCHCRHLKLAGKKMARRTGSFLKISDLEEKGYHPLDFRMLALATHYRNKLNFTWKAMDQARESREKIDNSILRLQTEASGTKDPREEIEQLILKTKDGIKDALDDDLNTPKALGIIFDTLTEVNGHLDKRNLFRTEAQKLIKLLQKINHVFAFFDFRKLQETFPKEVRELVQKRQIARQARNFEEADEIRKKIEKMGYLLEDLPGGNTKIKRTN